MGLPEAGVFAFFGATLVLWIIPGITRMWAKRQVMEVTGVARTPNEQAGYDRKDWAVVVGLVAWLLLFPTALWLMDKEYL